MGLLLCFGFDPSRAKKDQEKKETEKFQTEMLVIMLQKMEMLVIMIQKMERKRVRVLDETEEKGVFDDAKTQR